MKIEQIYITKNHQFQWELATDREQRAESCGEAQREKYAQLRDGTEKMCLT